MTEWTEQTRQTCREALVGIRKIKESSIDWFAAGLTRLGQNEPERSLQRLRAEVAAIDAALAALDAPQPPAQGLDMPDGVGWWAYEDHIGRWVAELTIWKVSGDVVNFCFARWEIPFDTLPMWQFKRRYPGKWYRLTMPWEASHV